MKAAIEPAHEARPNVSEVKPLAVYYLPDLERFGLKKSSVRREYRMGRLRLGKRLGRAYVLGAWLMNPGCLSPSCFRLRGTSLVLLGQCVPLPGDYVRDYRRQSQTNAAFRSDVFDKDVVASFSVSVRLYDESLRQLQHRGHGSDGSCLSGRHVR
jgi:hypothetical protein